MTQAPPALTQQVVRRDGSTSSFDPSKISVALTKAFLAVEGRQAGDSSRVHETVQELTESVVASLTRHQSRTFHIEDIQDQVELALMRDGHHRVARAYVLYREEHTRARLERDVPGDNEATPQLQVKQIDGELRPLDTARLTRLVEDACAGLDGANADAVLAEIRRNLYDGMTVAELEVAQIMAARTFVEADSDYAYVSARLLLDKLRREALTFLADHPDEARREEMAERYPGYFQAYVHRAIELELLDPELARFDLDRIGKALKPERDEQFQFLGLQTLYDRYFQHSDGIRFELPQAFFMRVAMGVAIREIDREARAIEFYELLSSFDFMHSTPTLFNAGTTRPQLSSCFLTTVDDDLDGIFQGIKNNALLAKYSGGLGNDWTPVRGMGAHIKGTNGKSQGVVPFLKVANDTAVAVNQGGRRKGAACAYLETWHIDIEEFLDLRKNTGDDRRRTHDMNTANWVPDLFIQRVEADGHWTLFSPDEVPELHDLYGTAFAQRYEAYEAAAERGELKVHRRMRAVELWRRMLSMVFETGHPWITFKDPCNLRSPQQHSGVVHSSNLCTEITLNTTVDEVAVCNLGSVNLLNHVRDGKLDKEHLARTVRAAVRAAGQRDRRQLLHDPGGTPVQPQAPSGGPRADGLPGRAVRDADPAVVGGGGGVRGRVDGGHLLPRDRGLVGARGRARIVRVVRGIAVEQGDPADRLGRAGRGSAWRRRPDGHARRRWTGSPCASRSGPSACATRTSWRSRRPRRSPTSAESGSRSSRCIATCT